MKINFRAKLFLLGAFLFSFLFISCNSEDERTITEHNPTNFREKLVTSNKIRTEDMIVFRTKLHEAVNIGQKGDIKQYQEKLLEASIEYLNFNEVIYDNNESTSSVFSKALTLYSDRMKELNSPKN